MRKLLSILQDSNIQLITKSFLKSIIDVKTPSETKKLGHLSCENIDEWDLIKDSQMKKVLLEKFKDPELKQIQVI